MFALGIISAYLATGFFWSYKMLPVWWENSIDRWSNPYSKKRTALPSKLSRTRYKSMKRSVQGQFFWKPFIWPVLVWSPLLDKVIETKNPSILEEKIREQEKEIKQREKREKELEQNLLDYNRDFDRRFLEAMNKHNKTA